MRAPGTIHRVACLIWGVRCVLSLSPAIRTLATIRLPSANGRRCTASRCRAIAPDPPKQTLISCADPGRPRVRRPKRSRRPVGGVHGLQFAASGHGRKRYKRGTNPPTFTPVDSISKHSTAESGSRHGLHQSAVGTPPIIARHVQRETRFSPKVRPPSRASTRLLGLPLCISLPPKAEAGRSLLVRRQRGSEREAVEVVGLVPQQHRAGPR